MPPPPIWLIAGPTAGGKSGLALALAEATGGEIVNGDSMQVYRDLRILTARPSVEDEVRAPHHLYGVADGAERWSVGRWLAAASEALSDIAARGRTAIVVGGTGLYFRALTRGLADVPAIPAEVRAQVQTSFDSLGETAFRERLAAVDPEAATRISPGDRQRLTRALEVFDGTGRSLSRWQAQTKAPVVEWSGVVLAPPRAELYARIDARMAAMMESGASQEVERLLARKLDAALPVMKALGVAGLAGQLRGDLTPAQALAQAQTATRQYAKRQMTWFEHQTPDWPRVADAGDVEGVRALLQGAAP